MERGIGTNAQGDHDARENRHHTECDVGLKPESGRR